MSGKLRRHYRAAGISGVLAYLKGKITGSSDLVICRNPDIRHAYHLRIPSSDVDVFRQIFIEREYDFEARRSPSTIIDAGANIGLASIYFANRFPDARIIAIEPEASNYSVLEINIRPYRNITPIRAALWHRDEIVNLVDPDLGKWGFMTRGSGENETDHGSHLYHVEGVTVTTIMNRFGIDRLDILKIDIEGAEREVFSEAAPWLGRVDALIVELHEHMKPGCNRNFYDATNDFPSRWSRGENVFMARAGSCLSG